MKLHIFRLRTLSALLPLLVALLLVSAPMASAHRSLPRSVDVTGNVVNSSHGDTPLAGQTVTLVEIAGGQSATVASATTDAHGAFTIGNVTPDANASYTLEVQYQGGVFTSASVDSTQIGAQPVTLHVFDTTSDDSNVLVALTTLVLNEPNATAGLISVAESVTVYNTGLKAYVATLQPVADKPMNLLRFALPTGAKNLVLGAGFATVQVVQAPTGFGVTATVPPGSTEFAFAYDLPYSASTLAITTKSEYVSRQVVALLPTDLRVDSGDFIQKPDVSAAGGHFQLLEQDNVPAAKTLSFSLHNLPLPGEPQYLDIRALGIVGLLLAMLLLAALVFYLRRGNLGQFVGVTRARVATRSEASPHDAERKSLLRQHLALDDLLKGGKLDAPEYERRRAAIRERLRTILAEQQVARDALRTRRVTRSGGGVGIAAADATQPRAERPESKVTATPGGTS